MHLLVEKLENVVNYNLEYASKYGFNDLALKLTHFYLIYILIIIRLKIYNF